MFHLPLPQCTAGGWPRLCKTCMCASMWCFWAQHNTAAWEGCHLHPFLRSPTSLHILKCVLKIRRVVRPCLALCLGFLKCTQTPLPLGTPEHRLKGGSTAVLVWGSSWMRLILKSFLFSPCLYSAPLCRLPLLFSFMSVNVSYLSTLVSFSSFSHCPSLPRFIFLKILSSKSSSRYQGPTDPL